MIHHSDLEMGQVNVQQFSVVTLQVQKYMLCTGKYLYEQNTET
jgi:hypothetical protein